MTESTDSTTAAAAPQTPTSSFWEDCIEIFVHPADVYRRRANTSFWPPFLFVVVLIGVIGFATFDSLQAVFEAEMQRGMAASSTKLTPEQIQIATTTGLKFAKFFLPVPIAFGIILLGFITWLVGKMFSSKANLSQAFVVVAWAYYPRIISSIAGGIQGLFMDPSNFTSAQAISLSPARFMDVATANPILFQLMGRLDITILWETALLAIGVYVIGKISKSSAVWFGVTMWVLGSLLPLRQAFLMMK